MEMSCEWLERNEAMDARWYLWKYKRTNGKYLLSIAGAIAWLDCGEEVESRLKP
jgi:hypothetical protein